MKTKHTPGPWFFAALNKDARSRGYIRKTLEQIPNMAVAKVMQSEKEIGQANAHLISAAPDLLAALDRVYLEILQFLNEENFNRTVIWDAGYIVEALAKARGEQ